MARPSFKITPDILGRVKLLASTGLTNKQIAQALGICEATLFKKKRQYAEFTEAIKEGQSIGIAKVSNALFMSAVKGNTTAQIFYLKNRSPDTWNDKVSIEQETKIELKQIEENMSDEEAMKIYLETIGGMWLLTCTTQTTVIL